MDQHQAIHHHIGGGVIFLGVIVILAIIAAFVYNSASKRKIAQQQRDNETHLKERELELKYGRPAMSYGTSTQSGQTYSTGTGIHGQVGQNYTNNTGSTQPVYVNNGSDGFVEGMVAGVLMEELLQPRGYGYGGMGMQGGYGGGGQTIIEENNYGNNGMDSDTSNNGSDNSGDSSSWDIGGDDAGIDFDTDS